MDPMPALFIGHGSPMNTLERNGFTNAWRTMGERLPRSRGLLVVSAHWSSPQPLSRPCPDRARCMISTGFHLRCGNFMTEYAGFVARVLTVLRRTNACA